MKAIALITVLVATAVLAAHPDGGVRKRPQPARCQTAADCHGMTPKSCQVCGDGGSQCAHWACVKNACEIVTCE